jgi:diguanylate cyclase
LIWKLIGVVASGRVYRVNRAEKLAARQALRLKRLRLAMLSWLIAILMASYAWWLGLLEMSLLELIGSIIVIAAAMLFSDLAVRRNWNLGMRDPSLTMPLILFSVLIALWVVSRAPEARGIMLMLFIMSMMFGMFRLDRRQYALVAGVAVSGYLVIFLAELLSGNCNRCADIGALQLGVFAAVMFWMAYIGSYVSRLRRALNERNDALEALNTKLSFLAGHDDLTGLPNRRRMLDSLEQAGEQARKSSQVFCLAMLDLDRFKQVNDNLGHAAGDEVLVEFARRANQVLRGEDTVTRIDESMGDMGRFGGEEFLAILHQTDLNGARQAGERLRLATCEEPFLTGAGEVNCTVSVGIASYRPPEPLRATLARADRALYHAKETGRDRVVLETDLKDG